MRNARRRNEFITGLGELLTYLTTHPEVPVPDKWTSTTISVHVDGTEEQQRAQINHIAQLLDAPVNDRQNGQIITERTFGPITYGAVAITEERMRQYHAGMSYRDCVIPDDEPAASA